MIESINVKFNGQASAKKVNNQVNANSVNNLFATNKTEENKADKNDEKALLEAELVSYENELKALEAEKAAKESDKKALESQKAALQTKANKIQSEIDKTNKEISQYTDEVAAMNDTITAENEEIENLQKQYDEANKEAQEISNKMNAAITQLVEDSNNNVEEQKALIAQVTQEAYAKAASGEIDESEVAQYIAQRAGNTVTTDSASAFSAINSMSAQLKALITEASSILTTITAKQANISNLQGQVVAGNEKIAELNTANNKKIQSKASVNKEINNIDKEITRTSNEINVIDTNINQVNNKIAQTEAKLNPEAKTEQYSVIDNNKVATTVIETTDYAADAVYETPAAIVDNPFISMVNSDVDYTSLVEALDAMSKSNDIAVENARTQDNKNNQEIRELFQGLLK